MKACFINPSFKVEYGKFSRESRSPAVTKSGALYYPLWLMYAAALTEKNGAEIQFIDAPARLMSEEEVLNAIAAEKDEHVLFVLDTSTPSIDSDIAFAETLKTQYSNCFTLLVGTHPTACYNEILESSNCIDAIARHEYDKIVVELYKQLSTGGDWRTINGLAFKSSKGEVVCNPDMEYITDLDSIPFASEFMKKYGINERDYFFAAATFPSIQIFTGRGCPCQCNFCVYPQTMHGHKFRARSAQNVVDEFEYIAANFPDVKEVVIEDDTFTINKKRVVEICTMLIERKLNKRLKWLCNARVDLDLDTMRIMKKAGCRLIIPGIESGTQEILDNIQKGTKLPQIYAYVKNAKKAGLLIHACYMVGNPGETKETMQKTLKLALKLNTDTAQFFPLIPYPGTKTYSWAKSNGYLTSDHKGYCKEDGSHNTVLNLPNLSAQEMVDFCNYARKKYYLRPKYIIYRLWRGITNFDDLKRSLKAFGTLKKYLFKK
ncbi:MAG: B12-binding domain-containing radical SAM protein [Paludibacteraceae bacterium]|nr:B12-binding domain-containing radical SAM protein [Paludibacteraceae bacterium]